MAADISVKLHGHSLKNPIILASGEMGNSGIRCKEAALAGAGAIVTKTLVPKEFMYGAKHRPKDPLTPRCYEVKGMGTIVHISFSTPFTPEEWCDREVAIAREGGVPVIVSLGVTQFPIWRDYWDVDHSKRLIEKFDKIAQPAWYEFMEGPPERIQYGGDTRKKWVDVALGRLQACKEVSATPIVIKPQYRFPADMVEAARAFEQAGAYGLVLGCGHEGADIDVNTGNLVCAANEPRMNVTGRSTFHTWLKVIIEVCRNVTIPVQGASGVWHGTDVIKHIMAGCVCSQMITCPMIEGLAAFKRVANEVQRFMDSKGYDSLEEIRGITLRQMEFVTGKKSYVNEDLCTGCGECTPACYGSVAGWPDQQKGYWAGARIVVDPRDGKAKVNYELCEGCGACVSACPENAIELA